MKPHSWMNFLFLMVLQSYFPWIHPKQARKAVEIAREETIKEVLEWLNSHYRDYMYNPTEKQLETFFGMDMIEDLKKTLDNINLNNK